MRATTLLALAGTLTATTAAVAQPVTLTIDTAQSTIDVIATAFTPVGDETDSVSTAVTGAVEIVLDDYGAPASITVNDFDFALTTNPTLNFDFGFLGSADATLSNAVAVYATPTMPTGPVPVDPAGAFDVASVPTLLTGAVDFSYSFFLVGSDSGTIDLADQGVIDAPLAGTVTSDGTTVTLRGTFDIDALVDAVPDLVSVQLVGTATLVATGDAPAGPVACNPADLATPFGILDLSDVDAFIPAFLNGDAAADLATPLGILDLADIDAFIGAFLGGCP